MELYYTLIHWADKIKSKNMSKQAIIDDFLSLMYDKLIALMDLAEGDSLVSIGKNTILLIFWENVVLILNRCEFANPESFELKLVKKFLIDIKRYKIACDMNSKAFGEKRELKRTINYGDQEITIKYVTSLQSIFPIVIQYISNVDRAYNHTYLFKYMKIYGEYESKAAFKYFFNTILHYDTKFDQEDKIDE